MTRWKYSIAEEAEVLAALKRRKEAGDRWRVPLRDLIVALVLAVVALALVLTGCSSIEQPSLDAGSADAGADHEPQCRALAIGETFAASDYGDAGAVTVLNQFCTRVCRNTTGGQTCINTAGVLESCRFCEEVSP